MRTWSAEELFVKAYTAGAVAVQGVLDAFTRRPSHDYDTPLPGCPNPSDCREYSCAGDCSEAMEVPNPTEPSLSDDELVAVRGLIQERYDGDHNEPYCGASQYDTPSYLCTRPCGHRGDHSTTVLGRVVASWPPLFAGAAASLADGDVNGQRLASVTPSVSEDKQQPTADPQPHTAIPEHNGYCVVCDRDASDPIHQSVPVPPAGTSGEGGTPPRSPSPRPAWSDLADAMVEHRSGVAATCHVLADAIGRSLAGETYWVDYRSDVTETAYFIANQLLNEFHIAPK